MHHPRLTLLSLLPVALLASLHAPKAMAEPDSTHYRGLTITAGPTWESDQNASRLGTGVAFEAGLAFGLPIHHPGGLWLDI